MYKRLFLACCFCMAVVWVLPGQAAQSAPVLSGGQDIDLLRIVVLDVSGSMDQVEARKAHSRLDTARQEILESIRQLPVSSKTPVVLIPFCEKVRDDLERIYRDEKSLKKAIVQLAPNGGTNIAAGLERAAKRASELGLCKNILLYLYSDGENTVGDISLVRKQEENLDKIFGLRASKGLSQTVVVKRWGGVIGQLVARLQKSPHVNVVDAGELELGTVTLVPSVRVKNFKWQNMASGMANVQIDVTVNNHGKILLPAQTAIRITCPSAGSRWLTAPMMIVTRPTQKQTFNLVVNLDPKKFSPAKNYALPLQFHGPTQVKTNKGLFILVINPKQVSCILPAGYLRPLVDVTAKLLRHGKPQWRDLDKRIADWPMRLQLTIKTTPAFAWFERIQWNIYGLNGLKVSTDGPVVLQGRPVQVNVKLTRQVSVDQLIQGKPFSVQIELRAVNKPKTVILSSMRIVLTIQIEPPAIQNTRIEQKVSFVGEPQWASWSMRPNDPATSVKWWRDVAIRGSLLVLPENAAAGTMLGSVIGLTVVYEALYKKVVFYLTVGLVAVLVGTLLFWLVRMGLGASATRPK